MTESLYITRLFQGYFKVLVRQLRSLITKYKCKSIYVTFYLKGVKTQNLKLYTYKGKYWISSGNRAKPNDKSEFSLLGMQRSC